MPRGYPGTGSDRERQARYRATANGRAVRRRICKRWAGKNRPTINASKRRRYAEQKSLLDTIKLERGCVDCGYKDNPAALDFDHLYDKRFNISWKYGQVSDETMLAEVAKCEVRCANCHRIRGNHT